MNVRWDAVVTRPRCAPETPAQTARRPDGPGGDVGEIASIEVWLYGALGERAGERPIRLRLGAPFSIDEVIGELGRRLGDEFLVRVQDAEGRKFPHCRVFIDGAEVDDSSRLVHRGPVPATAEMILLTAIEGG
ncbi:MoaD/ThiS family protein [Aromatoleum toluclasticum]|uniref:MoaD/ThiS family protein n=1 Tax=Aromatoleum toluclasticum TaxID=92003 RepID=UPI0003818CB4|nr:MoaD/ThiS family protein [Aromatoleum toluclasticum]MCC4114924.1 MoaD/ThiS family protein [Aromatoleum toluclasticum]